MSLVYTSGAFGNIGLSGLVLHVCVPRASRDVFVPKIAPTTVDRGLYVCVKGTS